ncbi:MAG: hypothetical protein ACPGVG_18920 [Mycobacterium sp.]
MERRTRRLRRLLAKGVSIHDARKQVGYRGGYPESPENVKLRRKIRRWRERRTPMPWSEIADRVGKSQTRCQVIAAGPEKVEVINPHRDPIQHRCTQCGSRFTSRAMRLPWICSSCLSWSWNDEPET